MLSHQKDVRRHAFRIFAINGDLHISLLILDYIPIMANNKINIFRKIKP